MKLDRTLRARVAKDWESAFPRLTPIGRMTFVRRFDGLLVSLLLDVPSSNVSYVPQFVVTLLTEPFDGLSLDVFDSLRSPRTRGRDEVSARGHVARFAEAVERMRTAFPWLDAPRLALSEVLDLLRAALAQTAAGSYDPWLVANPESVVRGTVRLLAHAGATATAEASRRELLSLFSGFRGFDSDRLAASLGNVAAERDAMKAAIERRIESIGIARVPNESLVVDLP